MAEAKLEIAIPYGSDTAAIHFAWHSLRRTFCGRDRYGWDARDVDGDDLTSAFACKRCRQYADEIGLQSC